MENQTLKPYMEKSYGDKIYKKNKRRFPFFWVGIIILFAAAMVLFKFMTIDREEFDLEDVVEQSQEVEEFEPEGEVIEKVWEDDFQLSDDELPFAHLREKKKIEVEQKSGEAKNTVREKSSYKKHRERKAREYIKNNDYEKALSMYVKMAENDKRYLAEAGICCYKMQKYRQAAEYLEDSLKYHQRDIEIHKYLAWSFYKLDDMEKTRFYVDEGLRFGEDRELMALKQRIGKEETLMDDYSYVEKVHFKIRFSQTEHREIETIVSGILDNAYREIGNQIDYYPKGSVTVILYNEKNFYDITRSPSWAGGLYDGKIHAPIGGYTGDERLLKRILYHEYVHSLVRSITTKCPLWLNEGLAEYCSEEDLNTIGQRIPLKYLNAAFRSSKIEIIATAYVQSFSVVSHLVNRYGMYKIKELLVAIQKGKRFEDAFKDVFFMPFAQFSNTWGK